MRFKHSRSYSEVFKLEAVRLSLLTHGTLCQLEAELNIYPGALTRWRQKFTPKPRLRNVNDMSAPDKSYKDLVRENHRLKKELKRAQTEAEILKKAQEYFAEQRRKNSDSSK
jgi:transposase